MGAQGAIIYDMIIRISCPERSRLFAFILLFCVLLFQAAVVSAQTDLLLQEKVTVDATPTPGDAQSPGVSPTEPAGVKLPECDYLPPKDRPPVVCGVEYYCAAGPSYSTAGICVRRGECTTDGKNPCADPNKKCVAFPDPAFTLEPGSPWVGVCVTPCDSSGKCPDCYQCDYSVATPYCKATMHSNCLTPGAAHPSQSKQVCTKDTATNVCSWRCGSQLSCGVCGQCNGSTCIPYAGREYRTDCRYEGSVPVECCGEGEEVAGIYDDKRSLGWRTLLQSGTPPAQRCPTNPKLVCLNCRCVCAADSDCADGEFCTESGKCRARADIIGASCLSDSDCRDTIDECITCNLETSKCEMRQADGEISECSRQHFCPTGKFCLACRCEKDT